ncbi:MAG TPA: Rieske 2Fe-2S domain-containing protein [Magnetospirillaceae bacterium]|jgi:phenylpropionate dioxygenase-like ring-hydroxylating dioxygenase large terminal subunit
MLSAQDNETLTRVGPGTPMGELMRQYWLPACKSSELVADGTPLRLMLLGEKLIGFRDSSGRVGIMDHRCPHRCVSLFFGRNEEGGLRCIYHGWKFDVDGNCLDMPNVPPGKRFEDRIHAKAYKTFERHGVVWVYMGARETVPPPPMVEATLLPEGEARVTMTQRDCNWLQALEGDLDTSHFGFLHMGCVKVEDIDPANMHKYSITDRAPEFQVKETDWGMMCGAYRKADPGNTYWRISHFLFPFWALFPDGTFEDNVTADAWVPLDDTHTMFVNFAWTKRTSPLRTLKDGRTIPGLEYKHDMLPQTEDWLGRGRLASNGANDHRIDREAQRTQSFTGVTGITIQDQLATESMGPIVDRAFEHLAPSDAMVARTRQRMLKAVRALAKDGTAPPGVDNPEVNLWARSGSFVAPEGQDWLDAYAAHVRQSVSPSGVLRAAE